MEGEKSKTYKKIIYIGKDSAIACFTILIVYIILMLTSLHCLFTELIKRQIQTEILNCLVNYWILNFMFRSKILENE